ncbi:HAD family hydrolase [Leptospira levettii]|uniref:HAD family hydrolase n=1 Tax=Leptospira levettii TaxID=2023178 RepID=UPI0010827DB6|nr:HAD family hydrolase [Leptospira levettii]MCW7507879.1 HAD family hydrolase [Leptospira levettii]MCW7518969.1 HAD family hydrolase [Leptospira levettii]TGK98683.1 HAD family hydrolase [Leptospira levettii]
MALFLDLDNTILPSKEAYAYAIENCAKDWGKRGLGDNFLELYEVARNQVKSQLKHHSSNRLRLLCFKMLWETQRSTHKNGFQTQDIQDVLWMEERYYYHFLSYYAEEKKKESYLKSLFPLLISLSKEFPVFLTTNETLRTQLLKIQGFLPDEFRFTLITSEEVGFEKPTKEFFQYVIRKAGDNPKDCIILGDSWEDDILGANSHGIAGIHIPEMWGEGDEVNGLSVDEISAIQKDRNAKPKTNQADLDTNAHPISIWRASNIVTGLTFARSWLLQSQK